MKYALVYGTIAGLAVIFTIMAGLTLAPRDGLFTSQWFGYLVMLIALTLIFVGVKRYRDVECGGVIRFLPALGLGLGIAAVSGLVYVLVWEVYLAATDYAFFDDYIASIVQLRRDAGVPEAEIAREVAGMESYRSWYGDPLIRPLITFTEIFPLGLLVALISAGLLRNPRLLPATSR